MLAPDPRTSITLLDGGTATFGRMLAAIRCAQRAIHLEVYSMSSTGIGAAFMTALANAARRGVKVQLVLDAWGTAHPGRIAGTLRQSGCHVQIYNPLRLGFVGRFRRNHRKLLLVDERVAFIGGINLSDEAGEWADVAVELRGPACVSLAHRLRHLPRELGDPAVRILLSDLGGGRRLRKRYIKAFGAARSRVLLAHSYFLPDRGLLRSMTAAARRGVAVTLLVPGRSDVPLARAATALAYRKLLAAGVRIFEWTDSILHAKLGVFDGERLLVGSFNLDPYSLADLEALVEARDGTSTAAAEAWIERHVRGAREIDAAQLRARGWRRWLERLEGMVGLWLAHAVGRLLAKR
jgi:cardiolipin synthase